MTVPVMTGDVCRHPQTTRCWVRAPASLGIPDERTAHTGATHRRRHRRRKPRFDPRTSRSALWRRLHKEHATKSDERHPSAANIDDEPRCCHIVVATHRDLCLRHELPGTSSRSTHTTTNHMHFGPHPPTSLCVDVCARPLCRGDHARHHGTHWSWASHSREFGSRQADTVSVVLGLRFSCAPRCRRRLHGRHGRRGRAEHGRRRP